jgi:hypothetical protein
MPYDEAPFTPWPDRNPGMAEAAEALASRLMISRTGKRLWAAESHAKALNADHSAEIVPLLGVTRDAFPRHLCPSLLARAPVVQGSITAATAAVAADAAAVCLVVSDRIAQGRGLALLAGATVGANPEEPGLAPLAAIARIWQGEPLAMAEIMEAYAVQAIAVVEGAGIDPAIVNPGGGGLARGHPGRRIGRDPCGAAVPRPDGRPSALPPLPLPGGSGRRFCWAQARERSEAGRIRARLWVTRPASTALRISPGRKAMPRKAASAKVLSSMIESPVMPKT